MWMTSTEKLAIYLDSKNRTLCASDVSGLVLMYFWPVYINEMRKGRDAPRRYYQWCHLSSNWLSDLIWLLGKNLKDHDNELIEWTESDEMNILLNIYLEGVEWCPIISKCKWLNRYINGQVIFNWHKIFKYDWTLMNSNEWPQTLSVTLPISPLLLLLSYPILLFSYFLNELIS